MATKVDPIPAMYGRVTPYLVVNDCAKAIEFYGEVFGAEEVFRMPGPDGKVGHAEIRVGDRVIMLADAHPPMFPPTSSLTCLYVEDCDAVFNRAVAAGATVLQPLEDKFYGDRAATIADAHGQKWSIMTHKEDVPPEEMEARSKKAMGG